MSVETSYLLQNQYLGVKRCKHGIFMFNRNDRFIGKSLDLYGEWGELEIELLKPAIRHGDVVLDVGANIGTHTVAFANMVGSTGRIHAFEPQRVLFQLLCGNIALNALENVWTHPCAVGSTSGSIVVPALPPAATEFNFGAVPIAPAQAGEKADLITLDSLKLNACRLIKIDVEGMEADVLLGARETISAYRPFIFLENNGDYSEPDVPCRTIEVIFELGYRAYWHIAPYFNNANFFKNTHDVFAQYRPGVNLLCEVNLLCIPKNCPNVTVSHLPECLGADDNWLKAIKRYFPRSATRSSAPLSSNVRRLE